MKDRFGSAALPLLSFWISGGGAGLCNSPLLPQAGKDGSDAQCHNQITRDASHIIPVEAQPELRHRHYSLSPNFRPTPASSAKF